MRQDNGETITVALNGEEREIPAGLTIHGLLDHLGLDVRAVVVERNREIVRRHEYESVPVEPGDTLELVQFVGGG
jgi:thiamine biosynthesis protein ThiS